MITESTSARLSHYLARHAIPTDNHYSDLYVKADQVDDHVRAMVAKYGATMQPFTNQIDKSRWVEIPFGDLLNSNTGMIKSIDSTVVRRIRRAMRDARVRVDWHTQPYPSHLAAFWSAQIKLPRRNSKRRIALDNEIAQTAERIERLTGINYNRSYAAIVCLTELAILQSAIAEFMCNGPRSIWNRRDMKSWDQTLLETDGALDSWSNEISAAASDIAYVLGAISCETMLDPRGRSIYLTFADERDVEYEVTIPRLID